MLQSPISPPANLEDPVAVADWFELALAISGTTHCGKSGIRASFRSMGALEEDDIDVQCEMLVGEIERRKKLAPRTYPFKADSGGFSIDSAVQLPAPYLFLLLLSISPGLRTERRQTEVEPHFDNLVLDSLKKLLGPGSDGVRFGTPVSGDRPKSFLEALRWLAEKLELKVGAGIKFKPRRQDGGVDVIAWRPFKDKRSGYPSILAQCTIQIDWRKKAKDIVEDQWTGWIDFGKTPLTCLAIPFVVPIRFEKWDEVRRTVVIVLDRMRIVELIEGSDLESVGEIRTWMEKELNSLLNQKKRPKRAQVSRT